MTVGGVYLLIDLHDHPSGWAALQDPDYSNKFDTGTDEFTLASLAYFTLFESINCLLAALGGYLAGRIARENPCWKCGIRRRTVDGNKPAVSGVFHTLCRLYRLDFPLDTNGVRVLLDGGSWREKGGKTDRRAGLISYERRGAYRFPLKCIPTFPITSSSRISPSVCVSELRGCSPAHRVTPVRAARFHQLDHQTMPRVFEKNGVAGFRLEKPFERPHQQIISAAVFRLHALAGDAHNSERGVQNIKGPGKPSQASARRGRRRASFRRPSLPRTARRTRSPVRPARRRPLG